MSFDFGTEYHSGGRDLRSIPPLWSVNYNDNEVLLDWVQHAFNADRQEDDLRTAEQICNLRSYKNLATSNNNRWLGDDPRFRPAKSKIKRLEINQLHDYTEQRVSRLSRFSPTVVAVPHTNEHSDKEGAEAVKQLIETLGYRNNFGKMKSGMDRSAVIFGESFMTVTWDESMGDIDERWVKAKEKLGKKKGRVKVDGEEFSYDPKRPKRIGDLRYRPILPWMLKLDPQREACDVEWCLIFYYQRLEKVAFDHPEKEDQLQASGVSRQSQKFEAGHLSHNDSDVLVIEGWHRSNKYLDEGLYFKCTPDLVLVEPEDNPYPRQEDYEFGNLPIIRLKDLENEGELHGYSSYRLLQPLNDTTNTIWNAVKQNYLQGMHLKLFVPKRSNTSIEKATENKATVIKYDGPVPPQFATTQTVPPETFSLLGSLDKKFDQMTGSQPTSRGDVPANIRSASQMQLMEEIEGLRASETIKKSEQMVVDVFKKTLAVAGKFYKENDQRLINILGSDKQYQIEAFKVSALHKPYDIRVLPASNLPQTPAARRIHADELSKNPKFASLIPDEMWADMIGLGVPGKFYDAATASVSKAEWENERFAQGKIPPIPEDGDNDIVHWRIHAITVESRSFLDFSEKQQDAVVDHILVHEMQMFDKAEVNPFYGQQIAQIPGFPKYYTPPPVAPQQVPLPTEEQQQTQARPDQAPVQGDPAVL